MVSRICISVFTWGGQNDDFRPLTYTLGGGAWAAGTNMWHPETPASYESLPAPLATQIPTLWIHTSGGGSDIRSMSSIRPICKCRCPSLVFTQNFSTLCKIVCKWVWSAHAYATFLTVQEPRICSLQFCWLLGWRGVMLSLCPGTFTLVVKHG